MVIQNVRMRHFASAALLAFSTPAAAEGDFCRALFELKNQAKVTHSPQRIGVIKHEEFALACSRDKEVPAQVTFCNASFGAAGLEFSHRFPWTVYDCLREQGVRPGVEVVDQYTGLMKRKKIVHLWGAWDDGVRLDIRFEPTGNRFEPTGAPDDAEWLDYWGVYRLVAWVPD